MELLKKDLLMDAYSAIRFSKWFGLFCLFILFPPLFILLFVGMLMVIGGGK